MKKWIFNIFLYVSLVFVVIYLYRQDYLEIPEIRSYPYFVLSLIFLVTGFIGSAYSWVYVLKKHGYSISAPEGIVSSGLSVFGKYIPGKLWVVLGRAEFLVARHGFPRGKLSMVSLETQLLTIWAGLTMGGIGLLFIEKMRVYAFMVIAGFVILTLILFTSAFHRAAGKIVKAVLKKEIHIPQLRFAQIIRVLPWFIGTWLAWILAFYFFANSFLASEIGFYVAWTFPLAATIGILAIIAPGGIGVREGVLFIVLSGAMISNDDATTVSVFSRLWFLFGELFLFILALILRSGLVRTKVQTDLSQTELNTQ